MVLGQPGWSCGYVLWQEVNPFHSHREPLSSPCLNGPGRADHPLHRGESAGIRARGLQPIATLWSLGVSGWVHGCPLVFVHYQDMGLRPAPGGAQDTMDTGRALWALAHIRATFPGWSGLLCAHLFPESPGVLGLVSCWLLA